MASRPSLDEVAAIDRTLVRNIRVPVRSVTGGTNTIKLKDWFILAAATGASNCTLVLPTAVGNTGLSFVLKRTDTFIDFSVIVNTTGGQTINGQSSLTLPAQHKAMVVTSDGSNWFVSGYVDARIDLGFESTQSLFKQTATVTVSNTTTETSLAGSGIGTRTVPVGFITLGRTFKIRARGLISTAAVPGTLTFRVKAGSVEILRTALAPATAPASLTDLVWTLEAEITIRSSGGATFGVGSVFIETAQTYSAQVHQGMQPNGSVNLNLALSQTFDVTVEWGTADASNNVRCHTLSLEAM